jgi:hypothetical protein
VLVLDGGAQTHQIIKVPVDDVSRWDATHDAVGRPLRDYGSDSKDGTSSGKGGEDVEEIREKPL